MIQSLFLLQFIQPLFGDTILKLYDCCGHRSQYVRNAIGWVLLGQSLTIYMDIPSYGRALQVKFKGEWINL